MGKTPKLAALAVVLKHNQVLLVQRKNPPDAGLWGYPGGHVDFGETTFAAAARELHEETGVLAQPKRHLMNIDAISQNRDTIPEYHFLLVAVLCTYVRGIAKAADDVSRAKWVDFNVVLNHQLQLSADVDTVLKRALMHRS